MGGRGGRLYCLLPRAPSYCNLLKMFKMATRATRGVAILTGRTSAGIRFHNLSYGKHMRLCPSPVPPLLGSFKMATPSPPPSPPSRPSPPPPGNGRDGRGQPNLLWPRAKAWGLSELAVSGAQETEADAETKEARPRQMITLRPILRG
jgi:hypothetical protein